MKKEKKDFEITAADVKVSNSDFTEYYAKLLRDNPKELAAYKKHVVEKYNKTGDAQLLLESLKIIAMTEKKITSMAKQAKVERSSIYKMLSKNANPSFFNVLMFANSLGINFRLTAA
jgi:probable addiction module antidote protein